MSTTPRIIADFETQLATAISPGGTTFTISSIVDDDGNTIPNGTYCFTIDNGTSVKEYLMGTMTAGVVSSVQSISRQGAASSGAVRAHRVGASVIITDFIAIKRVADILAGDDTLDGTSPLIYDTAPTLSDPKEVATVAYVLSVVVGGTVYFSSQTISATAGETLAVGDSVYFKEADQRWWKADADLSATYDGVRLGVAQSVATAGNGVTIQLSGIAAGYTSLTPGAKYYLSATAGGVTSTAPASSVFIGWAVSSTTILLAFQEIYRPNKVQKDFLAAVTGQVIMYAGSSTPSGFLVCDGSAVSRTTYADLFTAIGTTFGVGDGSSTFNLPDLRSSLPMGKGQRVRTMTFNANSDVNTGTDQITVANTKWLITGQVVALSGAALPTGLSAQNYYVIRVDATHIQLASSLANAQNGTAVDITAVGSGTATLTQTLTDRTLGETGGEETHAMSLTEMLAHTHEQTGKTGTSSGSTIATTSNSFPEGAMGINTQSRGGNAAMNSLPPYTALNFLIKT